MLRIKTGSEVTTKIQANQPGPHRSKTASTPEVKPAVTHSPAEIAPERHRRFQRVVRCRDAIYFGFLRRLRRVTERYFA